MSSVCCELYLNRKELAPELEGLSRAAPSKDKHCAEELWDLEEVIGRVRASQAGTQLRGSAQERTWGLQPLPAAAPDASSLVAQPRASGRPQRQKHGRALLRGPNTHDTRSGTPKRTPNAKDSLEEGGKLTPTAAGKTLTQVQLRLRLRLRLRASPCHRPAPPRRLTGRVVRRAPLLLTPTPHPTPPFPSKPRLRERPLGSLRTDFRSARAVSAPSRRIEGAPLPAVRCSSALAAPLDHASPPRNATRLSAEAEAEEAGAGAPGWRARVAG
uniref:uncharacterized protein LOC129507320 n=1 Tax=Nyctereutes procyonoides TaxID=34880 RepID=UPI0024446470|nr:uncharacterized protein LOC129507320 [Nyctereutes procyonoides]